VTATLLVDPAPLLVLAVVLVVGVASGTLARRCGLPSVTGQILAGICIGPILHLFTYETVAGFAPVIDFALGLMAVAVGSHLQIVRLRTATRRLAFLILAEALITPGLVFGGVMLWGVAWDTGLLLATIAVSTAPATILAIVKETRSKGVFVKTLVAAVALNNIVCIALFEFAHTAALQATATASAQPWALVLAPLRELAYAAVLGAGIGTVLVVTTRHVVRTDRVTTFSLLAILLTAGLADQLDVSSLLACLALGVVLANLTPDKEEIGHGVFENFETAIFAAFFTLAGMELNFDYVGQAGALALIVFTGRAAGKLLAGRFAMGLAATTDRVRRNLGLALLPQAGLAVGLMLLVTEDDRFPSEMRALVLATVLTVVTLNELIGPICTRIALARSGDLGMDRPRVIDFIHEEHILTDMQAEDVEDAIRQLTDLLVRTNDLRADRDSILASALRRETRGSTCLGEGLAVPQADLEEGDAIVGAVGISSGGMGLETPDGMPVHCMVLIATPPSQRDHRLEVMAALTRAILSDRGIEQQLYHAHTAAHAYEVLHHEESEDFNHFLED
jgi:Kef-type K+ transport system membrane component KefB/mannitol/fructose-specific phosphotransferase system IIA component (Ntr-type)